MLHQAIKIKIKTKPQSIIFKMIINPRILNLKRQKNKDDNNFMVEKKIAIEIIPINSRFFNKQIYS